MIYEFSFREIQDVLDKIDEYYSEEGVEYYDVKSADGMDFCAFEICIQIPELGIAVRSGMAVDQEDEDEQEEIVLVYRLSKLDYKDAIDIYSNVTVDSLIEIIAGDKGISEEHLDDIQCVIDTAGNTFLRELLLADNLV